MTRSLLLLGLAAALPLVALPGGASSQDDPIAQRRTTMKQVGAATGAGAKFVKGEQPFDLAKAKEILQTYASAAERMPSYYPENSKTGGDTSASPKIWEDGADFHARFDAWGKDAQHAQAETKDLDSFKAEFTTLTKACGSCHQTYRVKT